jgi:hypothetical protein
LDVSGDLVNDAPVASCRMKSLEKSIQFGPVRHVPK